MGWEFCNRTAPMAVPEASISMVNGIVKSGVVRTGAWVMMVFNY